MSFHVPIAVAYNRDMPAKPTKPTKPPTLTPKQEAFVLAYLETGNASEAYRRCYNAGRMKDETVWRSAKALLDNSKVATRLEELRAPAREKAGLTLESHLARLEELSRDAAALGQYSASVSAEVAKGRASGLYIERKRIEGPGGGPLSMRLTVDASVLDAIKDLLSQI